MSDYIFSLILLIITLTAIEVRKSYHDVPKAELRFRAQEGDVLAKKIYRAVSYEESLDILLWLIIILCTTGSLILFNHVAPIWLDFLAVAIFFWIAFAWLPKARATAFSKKLAGFIAPGIVAILNYLHPLFMKLYNLVNKSKSYQTHTGLYSKRDLTELIDSQRKQSDNRISIEDLELVKKGLRLADKTVGEYLQPWSKIKRADASEPVGPVLLDELHKSGQIFVPVIENKETKTVIGIVDLSQVDIAKTGRISDQMNQNVYYLDEEDSLYDAIKSMAATGSQVYIVRDKKQKPVGLITLKEVIKELVSTNTETKQ